LETCPHKWGERGTDKMESCPHEGREGMGLRLSRYDGRDRRRSTRGHEFLTCGIGAGETDKLGSCPHEGERGHGQDGIVSPRGAIMPEGLIVRPARDKSATKSSAGG